MLLLVGLRGAQRRESATSRTLVTVARTPLVPKNPALFDPRREVTALFAWRAQRLHNRARR
jgi:hypothetical protein